MAAANAPSYPIQLEVDPPAPQSRLTVFFRILMVIPHLIILLFLGIALGLITIVAWFAILITGSYPAGMMKFAIDVHGWSNRANGYLYLLTGVYPPFEMEADSYPIRFIANVRSDGRNRLTTFFRIILIIPHYIIIGVLGYAVTVVAILAWFAALFTGSVPAGLHSFIAGYSRWNARYLAYATLLCDEYPPFSFS